MTDPSGNNVLTNATTPEQARTVPCPICQVPGGWDCFTVRPPFEGRRKEFPHGERYAAFRQAAGACPHDPTGTSPYACACEDG